MPRQKVAESGVEPRGSGLKTTVGKHLWHKGASGSRLLWVKTLHLKITDAQRIHDGRGVEDFPSVCFGGINTPFQLQNQISQGPPVTSVTLFFISSLITFLPPTPLLPRVLNYRLGDPPFPTPSSRPV